MAGQDGENLEDCSLRDARKRAIVGAQDYFKHLHMCHGKWTKLVVLRVSQTYSPDGIV